MKVLFLDDHGVLQTPALSDWQEMEQAPLVEALLESYPDLKIVITSTQLEDLAPYQVLEQLTPALQARVIDYLPMSTFIRSYGGKQRAIEQWLSEHPGVTSWVAVDDEPFMFTPHCPWLVQTHKWVGWDDFTTLDVEAVLEGAPRRVNREVSIGGHFREKPEPRQSESAPDHLASKSIAPSKAPKTWWRRFFG